jgi:hypothetical protein
MPGMDDFLTGHGFYVMVYPYNQVTYRILHIIRYMLCELTSLTSFIAIKHCLLYFHIHTEMVHLSSREKTKTKNKKC